MATPNLTGITSVLPGILFSTQLATAGSANTLYTVGAARAVQMGSLIVVNKGNTQVLLNAGIIPSGGAADGTHDLIYQLPIQGGETIVLDEFSAFKWIGDGDKIVMLPTAANVINASMSGLVLS